MEVVARDPEFFYLRLTDETHGYENLKSFPGEIYSLKKKDSSGFRHFLQYLLLFPQLWKLVEWKQVTTQVFSNRSGEIFDKELGKQKRFPKSDKSSDAQSKLTNELLVWPNDQRGVLPIQHFRLIYRNSDNAREALVSLSHQRFAKFFRVEKCMYLIDFRPILGLSQHRSTITRKAIELLQNNSKGLVWPCNNNSLNPNFVFPKRGPKIKKQENGQQS